MEYTCWDISLQCKLDKSETNYFDATCIKHYICAASSEVAICNMKLATRDGRNTNKQNLCVLLPISNFVAICGDIIHVYLS